MSKLRLSSLLLLCVTLASACTGGTTAPTPQPPTCPEGFEARDNACVATVGTISGSVKYTEQTLHGGIFVALLGTDRTATTDDTGAFTFSGVRPGTYKLEARAPGYRAAQVETLTVTARATTAVATLKLEKDVPSASRLTGTVLLGDGSRGNSGTLVFLEGTMLAAFTNASGAYSFESVPPGTYTLVARHDGYTEVRSEGLRVTAGSGTEAGQLRLQAITLPVGTVTGSVQLAGATSHEGVTLFLAGTGASALSAADGRFTFSLVPVGQHTLVATRGGFVTWTSEAFTVTPGTTTALAAFTLQKVAAPAPTVGSVRGKATRAGAATGNAGITVYLEGTDRVAYTDDGGTFRLEGVAPGTYVLGAAASGSVSQRQSGLAVTAGQETLAATMNLTAAQPPPATPNVGSVKGRVTRASAATGNAGITVYLEGTDRVAYTDDAGAFVLTDVQPGSYALTAATAGYVSQRQPGLGVLAGQETVAPTVNLAAVPVPGPTVGSVKGRATRAGAATGNAGITVYLEGTDRVAFTDDAGAYRLENVAPGTYVLGALTTGHLTQRQPGLTVSAGQESTAPALHLPLAPPSSSPTSGTVRARVLLSGASSHAGTSVYLAGTSNVAVTDAAGAVLLTNVQPGTYTLGATRDGFEQGSLANVQVTAGQETTPADLTLAPRGPASTGGTVAGIARILGRADHRGVTARLTGGGAATELTAATEASGAYRFNNVPDGVYELVFTVQGFSEVRVSNVVASPGTFQVSDTLLRPASRVDTAVPTSTTLSPDNRWALLTYGAGETWGTRAYEVSSGRFVPLSTRPALTQVMDSAGHAVLSIDGSLYTATLATGALERITPAARSGIPLSILGQQLFYTDVSGNLYVATPGRATGTLLSPQGCQDMGFLQPHALPVKSSPKGAWFNVTAQFAPCSSNFFWTRHTQLDGTGTGWFAYRYMDPAGAWVVYLEVADIRTASDAVSHTVLKRLDFATGTVTTLVEDVSGLFLAAESGFARVAHATDSGTGRGKHSAVNLATGAVTLLASDAKLLLVSADNTRAVAQTGTGGSVEELRFDVPGKTAVCTGTVGLAHSTEEVVACTVGSSPVALNVLDRQAGTVRTLSSTAQAGFLAVQGRAVVWKEANATQGLLVSASATPRTLCASSTWTTFTSSTNGRTWVGSCTTADERWVAVDLQTGTSREVVTGAVPLGGPVNFLDATATPGGRGVALVYSNHGSPPAAWDCGDLSFYCTAFLDVELGLRTRVTQPLQFRMASADERGAFVASFGGGSVMQLHQLRFTSTGIRLMALPSATGYQAVGATGRHGLVNINWGAAQLVDAEAQTITPLKTSFSAPSRVGSHFILDSEALNLDTGALTPLGLRPQLLTPTADGFLYFEGDSPRSLRRYTFSGTVSTELSGLRYLANVSSTRVLYLADFDGQKGTLVSLEQPGNNTATVSTLGTGFGAELAYAPTGVLMMRNPSATSGDLVKLDLASNQVTDLKVRARRSLNVFPSNNTAQVLLTAEAADGTPYLAAAKLDGTGSRRLGGDATSASFCADGSRAFFTAGNLLWAEGKGGADAIAVDHAGVMGASTVSSNGELLLYGVGTGTYPESLRNGTYRLNLP